MRFRNLYFVFIVLISTSSGFSQLPSLNFGYSGNESGCAPHSTTFNISNISENTPHTTYQLNFGDGSPVLNYTQANVPSAVGHTYSSISCGKHFKGHPIVTEQH